MKQSQGAVQSEERRAADTRIFSPQIPIQPQERQETTQYSQINQMLRSLHLGRAKHKSTPEIPRETLSTRQMDTHGVVQSTSRSLSSAGPKLELAAEQDSVTRLYEETNRSVACTITLSTLMVCFRALGRLAISRRPYVPRQEVPYESSSDSE